MLIAFVVACAALPVATPQPASGRVPQHRIAVFRLERVPVALLADPTPKSSSPRGQATSVSPLRFEGLDFLAFDNTENIIVASGTEAALAQVEECVKLTDVEPRRIEVQVALARVESSVEGRPLVTALHQPTAVTPNGMPLTYTAGIGEGLTATATVKPRLNADDTVTVEVELQLTRGQGSVSVRAVRRCALNTARRVAWVPNVFDPKAANASLLGVTDPVGDQPGLALVVACRPLHRE